MKKLEDNNLLNCITEHPYFLDEVSPFKHIYLIKSAPHSVKNFMEKLKGPRASEHLVSSYKEAQEIMTSKSGYFFYGESLIMKATLGKMSVPNLNLHSFSASRGLDSHLILSKNSPYTRMIDRGIATLRQSGILDQIIRRHEPHLPESLLETSRSLNFADLSLGFQVYGLVTTVTGVILLIECLYHKKKKKWEKEQ